MTNVSITQYINSKRQSLHDFFLTYPLHIFHNARNRQDGGLQRNWIILIECPPYTEIFSKRRKIYSLCVEDMRR